MRLVIPAILAAALLVIAIFRNTAPPPPTRRVLRVCADPNNLPFSNDRLQGFENKIVELVARKLDADVAYTWWAQRRGFVRNTLNSRMCDVVPGTPAASDMLLATVPYYRSTYVFAYRRDAGFRIDSFDSPELKRRRIGVQLVGDDYSNTPPAHALARRGVISNVAGFRVAGDYSKVNPPAQIMEALARGDIDVAVAWGPLAGYFGNKLRLDLEIVPVSPAVDMPFLPFVFDISMGVRRGEEPFKREIDGVLEQLEPQIRRVLAEYHVPVL
jgi:mxaJ protein